MNGEDHKIGGQHLKLFIDSEEYIWPEQFITGEQIKKLANISQEHELFLKMAPYVKDVPINSETKIDLTAPGMDQFYSQRKGMYIIVNGREKLWSEREISFEQLVSLAFGNITQNATTVFTVSFKKGMGTRSEGIMVQGDEIPVKNKMIFNVTATDKS